MMIRVCFRRLSTAAAVWAAALMGIQDIAAQEFEEIVVTARKRDESVLEIPISVSAYTQDDLDALGMNTIEQLSTVTTGFAFQNISQGGTGGRHNPNIRFRGLGVQVESPASRAGSVFPFSSHLPLAFPLVCGFRQSRLTASSSSSMPKPGASGTASRPSRARMRCLVTWSRSVVSSSATYSAIRVFGIELRKWRAAATLM